MLNFCPKFIKISLKYALGGANFIKNEPMSSNVEPKLDKDAPQMAISGSKGSQFGPESSKIYTKLTPNVAKKRITMCKKM